ncbi:MAG TPA: DedA family protein [Polyangiaceae bacterium]
MGTYTAIFLAALSTAFVPVPEEAPLLAAGYAARIGKVDLVGATLAGLAGVLAGDGLSYLFGRFFLAKILRTRLGKKLLPERWRKWSESLVQANGAKAVIVARFLIGLRGIVYFVIGASRFGFVRFMAIDAAVGLLEVGGLVSIGFAFGALRAKVGDWVDAVVSVALVSAFVGPVVLRRWVSARQPNDRAAQGAAP